jgi:hypothetical protein
VRSEMFSRPQEFDLAAAGYEPLASDGGSS